MWNGFQAGVGHVLRYSVAGGNMKHEQAVPRGYAVTRRELIAGAVLLGAVRPARAWEAALPVAALDHVNIRVPDVRRSGEFYAKLFGVQVSRAENAFASAGTRRGELWFVRLGQSSLAISPAAPGEKPGIDHFCFGVEGFNRDAMKPKVAELNLQIDRTDPPGNNLWTKDPDGHLIQLSAPQNPSRAPGAGVGGVLVETKREPAFQPVRITQLVLAVSKLDPSATYYRKLLGDEAEEPQKGRFRVGPSELLLGRASGGEYFRVGVAGFDPSAVASKLKSLGVASSVVREKNAVTLRDPDGIQVQIGG
jgi:catechol 2,3-dioxygenase-like lactoylglutathione lyase family enzyme